VTIHYETLSYHNANDEVAPQVLDWLVVQIPLHANWTHVKTIDGGLRSSITNPTRREIFKCEGAGIEDGSPFDLYVGVCLTTSETIINVQVAEDFDDVSDEYFNPVPRKTADYATNADGGLGWRDVSHTELYQVNGTHNYGTTAGTAYVIVRDYGVFIGSSNQAAEYLGTYEPLPDYRVRGPALEGISSPPILATDCTVSSHTTTGVSGTICTRASRADIPSGHLLAERRVNWRRHGAAHASNAWGALHGRIPDSTEMFTGKVIGRRQAVVTIASLAQAVEWGAVLGLYRDMIQWDVTGLALMDTVTLDGAKWMWISNLGNGVWTPIE